ncbi:hypothetical protein H4S14_000885 [Agrobacterium vitis]|nr:hypothetical protein [Agrobacterium vitis]MBE1437158.1 hypothetical protein [Agrobacterium vitis]
MFLRRFFQTRLKPVLGSLHQQIIFCTFFHQYGSQKFMIREKLIDFKSTSLNQLNKNAENFFTLIDCFQRFVMFGIKIFQLWTPVAPQ